MNRQEAEDIVETLRAYSSETEEVFNALETYDYRDEANDWHTPQDPKLLEPEHSPRAILQTCPFHWPYTGTKRQSLKGVKTKCDFL